MTNGRLVRLHLLACVGALIVGAGTAQAYFQYSQSKDATNCAACHGDFRSVPYVSLSEATTWNDLHDTHRNDMLSGDCDVCHTGPGKFPVYLGSSDGGTGLPGISCSGCHGRSEDANGGGGSSGYGAGLRQHHWNAGVTICAACHIDADPANYLPADESILPPYYADEPGSDLAHPDMPFDPCNLAADGFPESYAGIDLGLDNDGDGLYDEADDNDVIPCPEPGGTAMLLPGIGLLLWIDRHRRHGRLAKDVPGSGPDAPTRVEVAQPLQGHGIAGGAQVAAEPSRP